MIWIGVAAVVLLGGIMCQLMRLNRQFKGITGKIKNYMDVICEEEEKKDVPDISQMPVEKKPPLPNVEDEKVFDEVLRELFQ